jgi:hypothetical protein
MMKRIKIKFCSDRLPIIHLVLAALFLAHTSLLTAQTINASEYFFDTDPGPGNGIPLVIPTPADMVTFSFAISTAGLTVGRHYFFIRTQTSTGNWSLYEPREFFIQAPVAQAEYFVDTDPGVGTATPLPITNVDDFTFTTSLGISGLSNGRHYLFIREKDESGSWSMSEPREFLIQAPVAQAEYFVDTDPGIGTATPLPITNVDDFTFTTSLGISGLSNGRHYLFIREKDESGSWSMSEPREFFIQAPIMQAEYFFDADPGIGSATPIPITTIDDFTFTTSLPVGGLPDGDHYLFVRAKDESDTWSLYQPTLFTVSSVVPVGLTNFSAERKGEVVDLFWTTASELNNDFFEVERWIQKGEDTYTEKSFAVIGRVEGSGTTSSKQHYQFSDLRAASAETIYYRLKQVDYDGKSTYSQVVVVFLDSNRTIVKLYPNPGSTWFTLEVSGKDTNALSVEVIDAAGKKIEAYEKVSGPLVFGSDWAAGVYLVRIRKPNEVLVVKIIKSQ